MAGEAPASEAAPSGAPEPVPEAQAPEAADREITARFETGAPALPLYRARADREEQPTAGGSGFRTDAGPSGESHEPPREAEPSPLRRTGTLPGIPVANLAPEVPFARLEAAESPDEVAAAVLDYLAQLALRVVMLRVRKDRLDGFEARGAIGLDEARALSIPVAEGPRFREALAGRRPYSGLLDDAPTREAVERRLGPPAGEVLILPITVGERPICVLYADGFASMPPASSLEELAEAAGAAYARLIRAARR